MASYSMPTPDYSFTESWRRCICERMFAPTLDQQVFCSKSCARDNWLRTLQGLAPDTHKEGPTTCADEGPNRTKETPSERPKPRSRFSKPLPRVLTIWKQEQDAVPPTPPPKSARHMPITQSLQHQQAEGRATLGRQRPASLDLSALDDVAPTPPLKSPRHLHPRGHGVSPLRIRKKRQFVVAGDAPPVPRVPSQHKESEEAREIRTYVPPPSRRNAVDSIPASFDQLELARLSRLAQQETYGRPLRTYVPPKAKDVKYEDSLGGKKSPASMIAEDYGQARPGFLRDPERCHVLGEDTAIIVPDGYTSDCSEAQRSPRFIRSVSRPSQGLSRPPSSFKSYDTIAPESTDSDESREGTYGNPRSFLDVHFPFDHNNPSDLWRALEVLRLPDDDGDYRARLVNRPTVYED